MARKPRTLLPQPYKGIGRVATSDAVVMDARMYRSAVVCLDVPSFALIMF